MAEVVSDRTEPSAYEMGLRDGQLLNPLALALDGAGGVYVVDVSDPRLQKFHVQS